MRADGLSAVLARIESIRSAVPGGDVDFAQILDVRSAEPPERQAHTQVTSYPPTDQHTATPPPAGAARWQASIHRAAAAAGVDPQLLTAVVWTESDFVPDAVSEAGAIGLAQLMPATAEMLGVDPNDPEQNLVGGARYLSDMIERYGGRLDLALAAYNAGPTRVSRLWDGGSDVPISGQYVQKVLDRFQQLGGTP
ncbi:MAG: lytic transglycosylase domain-containing protein [Thermoleophilia bacterium]|nr:lytic transglycosylase domain-containing protein [Thermoleophilia bacterium]